MDKKAFFGNKEIRELLVKDYSLQVTSGQLEKFIYSYLPLMWFPSKTHKLKIIESNMEGFYNHVVASTHIPLEGVDKTKQLK